jgi:CBS domain containing-hemolysin-like protein
LFWKITSVLFFVAANAFFVAAEFALVKLRIGEIEILVKKGRRTAKIVGNIIAHLDAYLSACQLGITLASLALGWIGEPMVARSLLPLVIALGIPDEMVHYISFPLAFAFITFLHITAGEQAPKIFAIQKYQATALFVSLPLTIFYKLFKPFIWLLNTFSNALLRIIGIRWKVGHAASPSEEELRHVILESAAGGYLKPRERLIMENVMDLEEKIARRYMIPRHQIVYINRFDSMEEKLRRASESGHTRFPLCEGDIDHIVGIIHIKDIFKAHATRQKLSSLADVMRDVLFIPETVRLDALLVEFQKRKTHIAMLVDEYGAVSGMITLENVLEELVGPIQDEFDEELPAIIKRGANQYEIDATCTIDEVANKCMIEIPQNISADTIGGLVMGTLGHIPKKGEKVIIGSSEITVLEAETTHVKRLLITKTKT